MKQPAYGLVQRGKSHGTRVAVTVVTAAIAAAAAAAATAAAWPISLSQECQQLASQRRKGGLQLAGRAAADQAQEVASVDQARQLRGRAGLLLLLPLLPVAAAPTSATCIVVVGAVASAATLCGRELTGRVFVLRI